MILNAKRIILFLIGGALVIIVVGGNLWWSYRNRIVVQTDKAQLQDLKSIVTASGEIKPKNYANVNADSLGKVTEILVEEGDAVKKSQVILRLESIQSAAEVDAQKAFLKIVQAEAKGSQASLKAAEAFVESARADLSQAELNRNRYRVEFERAARLLEEDLISRSLYDQRRTDFEVAQSVIKSRKSHVTQAKADLLQRASARDAVLARVSQARATLVRISDVFRKTTYTSPIGGVVTDLPVNVGENVVMGIQNSPGSRLFSVADMSVITAEVKVDETDIVNVKLGHPAEITIDAIVNQTFLGRVTEVGQSAINRGTGQATTANQISEEAKDFRVEVTLNEPPSNLRPGLSSTAKITTATRNGILTVPIQAVTIRQQRELQPEEKDSGNEVFASFEKLTREQLKEEIQGIFVVRDGVATFVSVKTGIMGTTEVEITNGLEDGEEVVSGSYKALRTLKNGAKIRVENKASGPNKNE